jgi:hypothetical protein
MTSKDPHAAPAKPTPDGAIVATGETPRPARKARKPRLAHGSEADWEMVRHTMALKRLTAVTALAAITATIFSGFQLWEMISGGKLAKQQADAAMIQAVAASVQAKSAKDQVKTMHDSLEEARKAVRLSSGQLVLSRESTERQQRAYLEFEPSAIDGILVGNTPHATFDITNPSEFPAYDSTSMSHLELLKYPPDGPIIKLFPHTPPIHQNRIVLYPQKTRTIHLFSANKVTDRDLDAFSKGESRYYAIGVVAYSDSFGKRHHVYECVNWYWDDRMKQIRSEICNVGRQDD